MINAEDGTIILAPGDFAIANHESFLELMPFFLKPYFVKMMSRFKSLKDDASSVFAVQRTSSHSSQTQSVLITFNNIRARGKLWLTTNLYICVSPTPVS